MEIIKLIGVLIVVIGFILKLDTLAVVVVAGLATGLVAGMSPMAQAAAVVQYKELDEKSEDQIKGMCAGSENYGNFFAQNCFMGSSGTLLIVSTLSEQGYPVDALQIAGQSVPIAVISAVVGVIYALIFDQILKRRLASKAAKEDK